jgi:isopentenyl phosphate kinase
LTLTFLKLGGSLITDKARPCTAHRKVIARLASEVRQALSGDPELQLLVGHGSGSFGHWAAKPYNTRQGVQTPAQWRGYAEVAAAAARLNRIVTDAFLEAKVPALSIQPSTSARCHDGELRHMELRPLRAALEQGLIPLVYGDVALDDARGGTIISTEDIFLFLARELRPGRILLLGEVEGVLGPDGAVIPRITPTSLCALHHTLTGSAGVDVTGGMADKVVRMVELVQRHPQTTAHIITGTKPGLLTRALLDPALHVGTRIVAR